MGYKFGDNNLIIRHIQQLMCETYNDHITINGTYYEHFDMNYGFAHYVAKYLDYMYPPCSECAEDYAHATEVSETDIRELTKPLSLKNYFLSNNNGKHLKHSYTNGNRIIIDSTYDKIYNSYMRANPELNEMLNVYKIYGSYFNTYDQPLFENVPTTSLMYPIGANNNPIYFGNTGIIDNSDVDADGKEIFTLQSWSIDKDICELDNFVVSYLLGRTITENSSPEEIYHVQKLLINKDELGVKERGVWKTDMHDLTKIICQYQSNRVNRFKNTPIFVTGYFDIFTESIALFEYNNESGDNSVCGL